MAITSTEQWMYLFNRYFPFIFNQFNQFTRSGPCTYHRELVVQVFVNVLRECVAEKRIHDWRPMLYRKSKFERTQMDCDSSERRYNISWRAPSCSACHSPARSFTFGENTTDSKHTHHLTKQKLSRKREDK